MLQSEKVVQNYYDRINELNNANSRLAAEIKQERNSLAAANERYTEHVKQGEDDQADDLIEDMEALEQSIKKKSKRLETKKSLEEGAHMEEALKALSHVSKIKNDFSKDVADSDERLKALLIDIDKELEHRQSIDQQYKGIYTDFIQIKDDNEPEDKDDRTEFRNLIKPFRMHYTAPNLIGDNVNLSLAVKAHKKHLGVNE